MIAAPSTSQPIAPIAVRHPVVGLDPAFGVDASLEPGLTLGIGSRSCGFARVECLGVHRSSARPLTGPIERYLVTKISAVKRFCNIFACCTAAAAAARAAIISANGWR